jgi:large subunit ribosomal protein L19
MLKEIPALKTGQTVKVHQKIKEGKKERIQIFEGMILAMKGKTPETKTITVRKVSDGVGVEKIYPLAMPSLEKIEIVNAIRTRRSKLYYLKRNYKKKLKESKKKK